MLVCRNVSILFGTDIMKSDFNNFMIKMTWYTGILIVMCYDSTEAMLRTD